MVTVFAAACGNSGSSEGNSGGDKAKTGSEAVAPAVPKEPVELLFYTQYSNLLSQLSDEGFMNDFGQYMKKKYPNFTFKTIFGATTKETLQTVVTAKTPIDMIQISPVQTFTFVDLGVASDISDQVKKNKLDTSKLEPSTLDLMTRAANNQLVGLPYQINSLIMFYNKDLFDKFGVAYPKDNMTWETTVDLVKRLTRQDGGVQYVGFGVQQGWANILRSNQLSLEPMNNTTRKTSYDSPDWKRMLEMLLPIYQVPGNDYRADAASIDLFQKSQLAMIIAYPEFYQRIPGNVNWDMVTAPMMKDKPGVNFAPVPLVLAPVAYSSKRDAAFLAISEMLSEEVQLTRARKYGLASVLNDPKFHNDIGADVAALKGKNRQVMQPLNMAKPITFSPYTGDAMSGIGAAFTDIITGKKDVNTALRDQADTVDKKIAQLVESRGGK
jgi:multiple sugar transport system substrate-binding protein